MSDAPPLEVRDLTKHFPRRQRRCSAAQLRARRRRRHASRCGPGTITALVGESGSGKSTVARLLARLYDADRGQRPLRGRRRRARPQPARDVLALPLAGADDLPGSVRRR